MTKYLVVELPGDEPVAYSNAVLYIAQQIDDGVTSGTAAGGEVQWAVLDEPTEVS